jgi:hypothetical protein
MDPSPHKPFSEEARRHGFDPEWLLSYARQHLDAPPEDVNAAVDTDAVIKPLLDQLNRHPISAIWVANFKSFGPRPQRFPLAPVTLVFGPNSAGKSSLMQALLYVQHALLEDDLDIKHPRGAGTTVDLGGFQNVLHRHAENGVLTFGFEYTSTISKEPVIWWVTIGSHPKQKGLSVLRASLDFEGTELLSTRANSPAGTHEITINTQHPWVGKFISVVWTNYSQNTGHAPRSDDPKNPQLIEVPEWFVIVAQRVVDGYFACECSLELNGICPGTYRPGHELVSIRDAWSVEPETAINDKAMADAMNVVFRSIFETHFIRGVISPAGYLIRQLLTNFEYLSSARILPGRDFENINFRDRNHPHNGGSSWDALRSAGGQAIRDRLNEWFSDLARRENRKGLAQYRFETSYDLNRNLVEEIIETEAQNYITGTLVTAYGQAEHGEDGATLHPSEILAHVDTAGLVKAIREAIEAKDGATTNHRLQIVDARVGRPVTPADIGVGIQYLIPVLVEILGARGGTKIIEEPELHAHPALQAELGDTLIEGALREEAPGRFIVETHSEHLILRILRRIREASERSESYPERLPKVRPEDVAVIYAEPSSEGTILHHLKISEDGDFIDRWPAGFFTERADELF